MDVEAELRSERAALAKADQDIQDAEDRIRKQQDLTRRLTILGHDTEEAERLIDILQRTLVQWEIHRRLMQQRIVLLEKGRSTSVGGSRI